MKIVGDLLSGEALKRGSADEMDWFARSAINRYYYTCFGIVRAIFLLVSPAEQVPGHKDLASVITKRIRDTFGKHLKKSLKEQRMTQSEYGQNERLMKGLLSEVNSIMPAAYSHRVTADYKLEIKVERLGGVLELDSLKLTQAAHWPEVLEKWAGQFRKAWKNLGF